MFEMGSHDPFAHLKHKLWPKEGPGVKLAICLPNIKSRGSTRFPYVKVMCDIPLESSQQWLQVCLKPHFNRRFERKVIEPQSRWDLNIDNFEKWESQDKMSFGCESCGET